MMKKALTHTEKNDIIAAYMGIKYKCVKLGIDKRSSLHIERKFSNQEECQKFCDKENSAFILGADKWQPVPDVKGGELKYHLSFDLQIPVWAKLHKECNKAGLQSLIEFYSEDYIWAINEGNVTTAFICVFKLLKAHLSMAGNASENKVTDTQKQLNPA